MVNKLWIALKFFVLLQSKQLYSMDDDDKFCCELLSNFLYFCSRNNRRRLAKSCTSVVNCSQIFCTFAVETTGCLDTGTAEALWIALKFFVLLQSKQPSAKKRKMSPVVNCSQIFCTFAVETTSCFFWRCWLLLWIALKFFVLLQSKQQRGEIISYRLGCELLSNFLYFCSRNNILLGSVDDSSVVNCSQIFCTFAVETTAYPL